MRSPLVTPVMVRPSETLRELWRPVSDMPFSICTSTCFSSPAFMVKVAGLKLKTSFSSSVVSRVTVALPVWQVLFVLSF